ncbi:hypothetical protein CRUP_007010 [Coryphaenoides rupestris]|nr:hypothetical protein CRUP_007010 [Coryphaenoides rupestris]
MTSLCKMILTVYLSDGEQAVTEVPVTPETTCRDVVEFCKEPGESGCHLAEVWRGNERAIPFEHMMYEHLQKWGPRKQEVKFFLRSQQSQDQTGRRSGEKHNENGVGSQRVELTLSELQEMASRQQQQIEAQQQMLVAKEQRLRYLKQQESRQQQSVSEGEKLQRLKDRVENQEAKLKKIRAMRGQVDYSKIRNKLNQEQNSKLQQQKDLLNKRNIEVSLMDKRISELRQRLHKKKSEARQKEIVPLNKANGPPSPQPALGTLGRVAAVGPYIQVPVPGQQQQQQGGGGYSTMPPDPLKPQTLGIITSQGTHGRSKSAVDTGWPTKGTATLKPPDRRDSGSDGQGKSPTTGSPGAPLTADKPLPPPYGSHHTTTSPPSAPTLERRKDIPGPLPPPRPLPNNPNNLPAPAWPRGAPGSSSSSASTSSQQIQQRISVPPSPTFQQPLLSPLFPVGPGGGSGDRPDLPLAAAAVRPFLPGGDRGGSRPQSPRKGPATMNSSSIYHMYLQQAAPKGQPPKPALKAGLDASLDELDGLRALEGPSAPPPSVDHIPRPLSPTKLTPMVHSPLRYQSDADLELLRKKLANAPRPLKKRSSITEPEGPSGPNIQKLLYQRFNTLAGGMEVGTGAGGGGGSPGSGTPFYQPTPGGPGGPDVDNGNLPSDAELLPPPPAPLGGEEAGSEAPPPSTDPNDNRGGVLPEPPPTTVGQELDEEEEEEEDEDNDNNNNMAGCEPSLPSPVVEVSTPEESASASQALEKRTNLKKPNSERTGHGLRVKFNPLALLLDASLEGEFDLVQRIIYEVENPSTANDEGITPLHNAVCAGHHHIVKFLLDFGVNVNAADSDGWTPLHCAASCNSVHLCKLLVESGAAIFASTISDVETAADKCEEMEEGYIQCSQFLYGVQEKLGVMNKGTVYALWPYEAQGSDELTFTEGDALTVLRRHDDAETDWWWARLEDGEGYVPATCWGCTPGSNHGSGRWRDLRPLLPSQP